MEGAADIDPRTCSSTCAVACCIVNVAIYSSGAAIRMQQREQWRQLISIISLPASASKVS